MSRRNRSGITGQDHLIHILLLGGFLVGMSVINFTSLSNQPLLIGLLAVIYVALNTAVDIKAGKFHADQMLEYSTIGLLAAVIIISF